MMFKVRFASFLSPLPPATKADVVEHHTDHILSMHHSLHYFERVLAHSHPAYLSYLNVSLSEAKSGSDEAILFLSFVSIGTVCLQFTTGASLSSF